MHTTMHTTCNLCIRSTSDHWTGLLVLQCSTASGMLAAAGRRRGCKRGCWPCRQAGRAGQALGLAVPPWEHCSSSSSSKLGARVRGSVMHGVLVVYELSSRCLVGSRKHTLTLQVGSDRNPLELCQPPLMHAGGSSAAERPK